LEAQRFARDFFTFQKTTQFVISACNATPSIVAVRVSNLDYRISVSVGGDRAFSKTTKAHSVCLFRFRIFPYSVHRGFCQPLPCSLSQFSGRVQAKFLFHPHLMRLNRFDADIQFTR
jgi:hypothetical protein